MENQKAITFVRNKFSFLGVLKVFWLIIPIVYLMYLWLKIQTEQVEIQEFLTGNITLTIMLLLSFLTPFSSYFLSIQSKEEQNKQGKVGMYLKGILVQQVVVGNIVGAILSYLSYQQLPNIMDNKQKKVTGDVLTLLVFQYMLSLIALFGLAMINFNR